MKKKEVTNKALFIQRFLAFIIDVVLVSTIASCIVTPFMDSKSILKLNESANEVAEKFVNQEIDVDTYFSEVMNITYQMARKNGLLSIVSLFLEILYFVVYQFYQNGQTIGKKLLKIKVVSNDEHDLTMNQMIFRSLIINSILCEMIVVGFMVFASRSVYFCGVGIAEVLQYVVLLISAFMVMFSKSGCGLHDLIAHTKVIRTDMVKELEVCES